MGETVDRTIVAEIINRHLAGSEFRDLRVFETDFHPETLSGQITFANLPNQGLFSSILNRVSPDRRDERRLYYHFKRPEHIISVLQSKTLQASWLPSHARNDNLEYTEFLRRTGLIDEAGNPIDPPTEDGMPMKLLSLEEVRKWIFILCFTRELGNPRFWKDYAVDGTGAALVLDVFKISDDQYGRRFFEIRDVAYETSENSDRFRFIREMQSELKVKLGVPLLLSHVPAIAAHYKQHCYAWEDEARLTVNVQYNVAGYHTASPVGSIQEVEGDRQYLTIPLWPMPLNRNKMFRVELRGLILGPNVGLNGPVIRDLMQFNFPNCFIAADEDEAKRMIEDFTFPKYVDEDQMWLREMGA